MYFDSLGNYYSESKYADKGVKGSYDKLSIRTGSIVTTFNFNLREDNPKRTEKNTTEEYKYLVIDHYKDEDVEEWTLERNDGARLTFTQEFFLNTYMLAVPANLTNRESYLYIFTKTK